MNQENKNSNPNDSMEEDDNSSGFNTITVSSVSTFLETLDQLVVRAYVKFT